MNPLKVLSLLLVSLLGSGTLQAAEPSGVTVSGAHIRAMPPTVQNTAAYFTLQNHGERAYTLTGAHADFAARVELHETMNHDGQLMMMARPSVELPAHGNLVLENGGMHLMVMGLKQALAPGQEMTVVLEFSDGSELPVTLPVQAPMAPATVHGGMGHDNH